jgi:glutathione S-transferase
MILIGQYDSPFVRRVGIALTLYDLPFEHRPWSVFGDGEKLAALNPVMRVPTLALDDGTVLTDSHIILQYLDGLVAADVALIPTEPAARQQALAVTALATGAADKAVSLFYELRLHDEPSAGFVARCRSQINGSLNALERIRAKTATTGFAGACLTHADIAVACMLRFISEAHPDLFDAAARPALAAHAARLEALPVFQAISQPFVPPA